MKQKIFNFLIYSIIISIGMFVGEWFLDSLTNTDRSPISKEVRDAVIIGVFTSFLLVFINNFRK